MDDKYDVSDGRTPVGRNSIQRVEDDVKNILALADTRPFIKIIMREWAGLDINDEDGVLTMVRVGKPKYTFEFCMTLANFLMKRVNKFTVRSDFSLDDINKYNKADTYILGNLMATEGMQNYVSAQAWKLSLDFLKKETISKTDKKPATEKTRWKLLVGFDWDYDNYFGVDHLNGLRKYTDAQNAQFEKPEEHPYPDLTNESLGQDNSLMEDVAGLMWFVDAGRRKSKDALLLKHERAVYTEQITQTANENRQGIFGKMMSGIKAMAGGGSQ